MPNIIKIKRSKTAGVLPASLSDGEIFINQKDRILAYADDTGTIRTFDLKYIGAGSLLNYNAKLAADVQLTTSGTWYDGATVSLPAGTYLITAFATVMRNATTATTYFARISDGITHFASAQTYQPSASGHSSILSISSIITIAATTTVKLQVTTSAGATTCLLKAALSANGAGNNATQINAIKL